MFFNRSTTLIAVLLGALLSLALATTPASAQATMTEKTANSLACKTFADVKMPAGLWFGALQAQPNQLLGLKAAGVNTVTLELGWDAFEPQPGSVNQSYLADVQQRVKAWKAAGFSVILDPGLQYPPGWAFDLPGGTRYVNQNGKVWTGNIGTNVVNAVFNDNVRAAIATYYSLLAQSFPANSFQSVRVGGMVMGELSYPAAPTDPTTLWMYDASAKSKSPLPNWKPGTGSAADARTALKFYFASINDYAKWLLATSAAAFPQAKLQLLLPSWGLRPGQLDASIAAGLTGNSPAERNGFITQGLDWTAQVDLLAAYPGRGVAYTTWLDAPSNGASAQDISPANYLYSLIAGRPIGLSGENTGGGGVAELQLSVDRAKALRMQGIMWMTAAELLGTPQTLQVC